MRALLLFTICFPVYCLAQFPSLSVFIGLSLDSKRFDQTMFENGFFMHSNRLDTSSNVYFLKNSFGILGSDFKPTNVVSSNTKFLIYTPYALEGGGNFMSESFFTFSELQNKYTVEQQQELFLKNLLFQKDIVDGLLYVPGMLHYSRKYIKGSGYQKNVLNEYISAMYFETFAKKSNGEKQYIERELTIKCSYQQFQKYLKEIPSLTKYSITYLDTKNYDDRMGVYYSLIFKELSLKGELIFVQPKTPNDEGQIVIRI
jgi:hypothetical protein